MKIRVDDTDDTAFETGGGRGDRRPVLSPSGASRPALRLTGWFKRISWGYWLVVSAMIVLWHHGMYRPIEEDNARLNAAVDRERSMLTETVHRRRRARRKIERVRNNDPYILEALARDKLGWGRRGEYYQYPH